MEKNFAILMADLSGYTAMTETHGAIAAADVVDKYLSMVNNCLVGECKLHERIGDEVMIISTSPDNLLATALMLVQTAHTEDNFLLLHGGMHYGKLLERNNSYFGTAINLTSRIASKATAGNIWCSQYFLNALSAGAPAKVISRNLHQFKNLVEEMELFELQLEKQSRFHVDPVCRMLIVNEAGAVTHSSLPGTYFCSSNCMNVFLAKESSLPA